MYVQKTWYYILIFFEVLLGLFLCLGLMVCIFEYETLNCICTKTSTSTASRFSMVCFRLLKDKRKAEVLAVLAFHICQLVTYFIILASI